MSRSVHTTKKHLIRERSFAQTDAVPATPDATKLERRGIQKSLHKINEVFRRQAIRDDAPARGTLVLEGRELTRTVNKRKTQR